MVLSLFEFGHVSPPELAEEDDQSACSGEASFEKKKFWTLDFWIFRLIYLTYLVNVGEPSGLSPPIWNDLKHNPVR